MKPRWVVTAILGAAILSPLLRERAWDSFPISSFPMFSRGDLGTRVWIAHVVLVDRAGKRRAAPPSLFGTPEVMVAKKVIEDEIARDHAGALCSRIAGLVTSDVTSVEVVTSVFDTHRYFEDRAPIERTVHASCSVSR